MGAVKRFAEEVSCVMGHGGEITDDVLDVAQQVMQDLPGAENVGAFKAENPAFAEMVSKFWRTEDGPDDQGQILKVAQRAYPRLRRENP